MSEERTPYLGLEFPAPRAPARDVWARSGPPEPEPAPRRVRTNVILFVATVLSVFATGAKWSASGGPITTWRELASYVLGGWTFAVPLMAILLCHEFGHYIAARIHRVDASLPYFLPAPIVSPFGTLGAVIAMNGRIRSRNALLDIGAAGPLAGMVVAVPVMIYGLSLSSVGPAHADGYIQEGQSLLYLALKRLVLGPIPEGYDVELHPTALAAWVGFLVTMINMLPWGQLDGGHVAYALFGEVQHFFARLFRWCLLPLFLYNAARFLLPVALSRSGLPWGFAVSNSMFWLMWFLVLGVIGRVSGGAEHPPTEPGALSPVRRVVAAFTLLLFVLLFMPTPLAQY
ncbi:MAG TPA: site-2 protease family protein [Polyangiaceae bacterium]|nr:site-2 protease family protein [Polyangiaceae bacterium]